MGASSMFVGGGELKNAPHKVKKGPHTEKLVAKRPPHGKKAPHMVEKVPPPYKVKNIAKSPHMEKSSKKAPI